MALKGTRGTTFSNSSPYWTTNNTLNPSDNTINDGDAKYNTYNYFQATDWLAVFPDAPVKGGDVSNGFNMGWTWVENNAVNNTIPLLTFFNMNYQVTKLSNGVDYAATNPKPLGSPKYSTSMWSTELGFQWYGINYRTYSPTYIRWGFVFNNESDEVTNDVFSGIGMAQSSYSAGDLGYPSLGNVGVNRSMRFMWFVR